MSNEKKDVQPFEKWEVEMAKKKARRLIGKYGFTESDKEDLEQQLLLHAFFRRSIEKYSEAPSIDVKEDLSRVFDNKIRKIKEHAARDKRSVNLRKEVLAESYEDEPLGDSAPWIISEQDAKSELQDIPALQENNLNELLEDAMLKLDSVQKEIVQLRIDGYGIKEIAQKLGCNRTTVLRQIWSIQKILKEAGLGN